MQWAMITMIMEKFITQPMEELTGVYKQYHGNMNFFQ